MPDSDITFVRRVEWDAKEPSFIPTMTSPARMVFFGYPQQLYSPTGKAWLTNRPSFEAALSEIKFTQVMDMRKYPDIRYNFMIAPDGVVFEGRGWSKVPTLPLKYRLFSHIAYYFFFIGDFTNEPPGEDYYITRNRLIELGIRRDYICKKFTMYNMYNTVDTQLDPYNHKTKNVTSTKY